MQATRAFLVVAAALVATAAPPARAEVVISKVNLGLPNTIGLRISGGYSGNEVLRVKSAIAELPPSTRVIAFLSSPGGLLAQGIELGSFFYQARIPTVVLAGDDCASACTHSFFGGRDPVSGKPMRILVDGGRLGFHSGRMRHEDRTFTAAELKAQSRLMQQIVYAELKYYQSVEAPIEAILLLHSGTKADDMHWLSSSDALDYGITVLNRETGKLVSPDNLEQRVKQKP